MTRVTTMSVLPSIPSIRGNGGFPEVTPLAAISMQPEHRLLRR